MYQNDPRRLIRVLIQIQQQFIILSLFIVPILSSSYLFSLYTYLTKTRILLSAKKTLSNDRVLTYNGGVMENSRKRTLYIVQAALIAAIYVVLTLVFKPISFDFIQVRIAEALTILPMFLPAAVPGLFLGCLIANFFGGAVLWDVIFGSLATLVGAFFSYKLKENRWLVPVPPIVANVIVVPLVLKYAYGISEVPLLLMMVYIFVGEFVSCFILGELLASVLIKNHFSFFKENDR